MNALIPLAVALLGADPPQGSAGPGTGPAPSAASASAQATPAAVPTLQTIRGRGVHYVDAKVGCLLTTSVGTRGPDACLRLGLYDDKTVVDVDRERRRIVLRNSEHYDKETQVGDVLLPGWSELPEGRSAAAAHLLIRKKGSTFHAKFHAHAMSREKPRKVDVEPYEVIVTDGKTETSVMTGDAARNAILDPGLAAKIAGELVEVKDNLSNAETKDGAPHPVGDVTIALGIGPAAKDVARAQLFRTGSDTELRITALSSMIPKDVLRRELFLYGIDGLPNLAEVMKRGLKSGEMLVVAMHDGKGTVRFQSATADLPDAANNIRGFLEGNFIGALLAHQARLDAPHP